MDINKLLSGVRCSCGRHHTCAIEHVFVEEGATSRLPFLLSEYKSVLLVADENTYRAAGELAESYLSTKKINRQIFPAEPLLIPNEAAVAKTRSALSGADVILGVGSGVVQDLCKYVSKETGIPYFIVATAPSMDGYASSGAAMITEGMKVTYPAGVPLGIIADVDVLKDAPMDMIKAGYGDVIGKYSALSDWRLAKEALGEYFCEYVYELTYSMLKATVPLAKKLLARDPCSIKTLTEALIGVGIAMSFAGNSRPASGSEHHLSHFFEITGIVKGQRYLPHGIDVAYSTLITSRIREKLLSVPSFEQRAKCADAERLFDIRRVYSTVADGCIVLQEKLGTYKTDRIPFYLKNEEKIRAALRECPSSSEIERLLAEIELDPKDFYETYGKEKIADAIKYAKDLKDRYTVLWLHYDVFGTESEGII